MAKSKLEDIRWQSEDTKAFAEYWHSLPKIGLVPMRSSFDPAQVTSLLPSIAIYQFLSRQDIRIRLAGTKMVAAFGQEITGKNYLDFWSSELKADVADTMQWMLNEPSGLLVRIVGITESGVEHTGTSVGFPLRDQKEDCTLLMFYTYGDLLPALHNPGKDKITSQRIDERVFTDLS